MKIFRRLLMFMVLIPVFVLVACGPSRPPAEEPDLCPCGGTNKEECEYLIADAHHVRDQIQLLLLLVGGEYEANTHRTAITNARSAFNALATWQRALVTNIALLETAEGFLNRFDSRATEVAAINGLISALSGFNTFPELNPRITTINGRISAWALVGGMPFGNLINTTELNNQEQRITDMQAEVVRLNILVGGFSLSNLNDLADQIEEVRDYIVAWTGVELYGMTGFVAAEDRQATLIRGAIDTVIGAQDILSVNWVIGHYNRLTTRQQALVPNFAALLQFINDFENTDTLASLINSLDAIMDWYFTPGTPAINATIFAQIEDALAQFAALDASDRDWVNARMNRPNAIWGIFFEYAWDFLPEVVVDAVALIDGIPMLHATESNVEVAREAFDKVTPIWRVLIMYQEARLIGLEALVDFLPYARLDALIVDLRGIEGRIWVDDEAKLLVLQSEVLYMWDNEEVRYFLFWAAEFLNDYLDRLWSPEYIFASLLIDTGILVAGNEGGFTFGSLNISEFEDRQNDVIEAMRMWNYDEVQDWYLEERFPGIVHGLWDAWALAEMDLTTVARIEDWITSVNTLNPNNVNAVIAVFADVFVSANRDGIVITDGYSLFTRDAFNTINTIFGGNLFSFFVTNGEMADLIRIEMTIGGMIEYQIYKRNMDFVVDMFAYMRQGQSTPSYIAGAQPQVDLFNVAMAPITMTILEGLQYREEAEAMLATVEVVAGNMFDALMTGMNVIDMEDEYERIMGVMAHIDGFAIFMTLSTLAETLPSNEIE